MDHNHLTIKTFMAIMAERDAAIQERNLALDERKRAFAERDMAMLQCDAAISERNSAMQERDDAIATLRFRSNIMDENVISPTNPLENPPTRGSKRHFTNQEMAQMFEIHEDNLYQVQLVSKNPKPRKVTGKSKIRPEFAGEDENSGDSQLGLTLNYDESTMPVPVCSCTGVPQPCYRWGNGGWQSACCTTTMSMYPLPQVSNKRYSRVGGRKMSGGAFTKLLTRLASEGNDLSTPLDLKDHWAKHGTNRYSTVK